MRVTRVTSDGRTEVSAHGVLDDDTVATAAVKLARLLGGDVYLWCYRPVDAHEMMAIAVAGGSHETGGRYVPAVAARELGRRFGVRVTAAAASTPQKLLARLGALDRSQRLEPVPMRNRSVIPGGYFEWRGVHPYEAGGEAGEGEGEGAGRPFNTGDLLVESFGADEVLATTRADLEAARPASAARRAWQEGFVARYLPGTEDRALFPWSREGERQLRRHRRAVPGDEPVLTYLPLAGGTPVGEVGMDALTNAFASVPATKGRPLVRLQGGGVDRPVGRAHSSLSDEELAGVRAPSRREWLQATFREGKGGATLVVFPSGAYKLQLRFGYLERARVADAVAYFPAVNAFLHSVSPLIRPVREEHLRPSSSLYIQKPRLLETPSVLGGPRSGVYQIASVGLPPRCGLREVADAVAAGGFPSLKAVNTHGNEFHMHWVRSSGLRRAALVKNLVHHSATDGGLGPSAVAALTSELGVGKKELAEIAQAGFSRHTVLTLVKVRLASDTALSVHVNGSDPEHGSRVAQTIANLLSGCGTGRAASGASDWSVSASDPGDDAASTPPPGASDLDEFYEFFGEEEGGEEDGEGEGSAEGSSEGEGSAEGEGPQKGDILERLKRADPDVFAFASRPGFVPYSMKCQKNNKTTRQPLVLSAEEAERAARESSEAGKEALRSRLEYRGHTYVCPEKWCPVSGVARGLGEACPDPDEPEWTMWSSRFPAFQSGVSHPKGLCMPCCFGTRPREGLKTWRDIQKCKSDAGEEPAGDGPPAASGKSKAAAHVSKEDKLLEEGALGFAPAALFPGGLADGLPSRPVRRGMGPIARATLARSLAFLLGLSVKGLRAALAEGLRPEHFVQGDTREFMPQEAPAAAPGLSKWVTAGYARALSLPAGRLSAAQRAREGRVMLAHRECVRRLAAGEPVSDASLLRFVNSGALGGDRPVMLLELDEAGNASAEHLPEGAMRPGGRVAAVLLRRGIFEPVGVRGPGGFDPWWDSSGPWPSAVFRAVRSAVPAGGTRLVSLTMMAVGTALPEGYLPFSKPVFVDPAVPHAYVSDTRVPPPAAAAAAEALRATGDGFYRHAWRQVASDAGADDRRDAALFAPAKEDRRAVVMRGVTARVEAARRATAALAEHVDAALLARLEGETARERVARVRASVASRALEDAPAAVVDFAIDSLARPVPAGVPPAVVLGKAERLTYG